MPVWVPAFVRTVAERPLRLLEGIRTLDHSVWLDVPARADGWMLTEFHPLATAAGRGLALGSVRAADGRLLASVTQEALLRLPDG